jgi:excisionase family DNA binding protein
MTSTAQGSYLTASELADVFKIKIPTVRVWTWQGMPHLRCGRLVRFQVEKVREWLEKKMTYIKFLSTSRQCSEAGCARGCG